MSKSITIDIRGGCVSLRMLADSLSRTNQILNEIDHDLSKTVTLRWDIGGLRFGSAQVTAVPVLLKEDYPDRGDEVVSHFKRGVELLEYTTERPPHWSDRALQAARELAVDVERGCRALAFIVAGADGNDAHIAVTPHTVASIDGLVDAGGTSFGSVEGTLEVVQGLNDYFTILDRATGRRVRCECAPELLDEIAGRRLFRQLLAVTGEIREDRDGHPRKIKVSGYSPVRVRAELPQPEDLLGLYRAVT